MIRRKLFRRLRLTLIVSGITLSFLTISVLGYNIVGTEDGNDAVVEQPVVVAEPAPPPPPAPEPAPAPSSQEASEVIVLDGESEVAEVGENVSEGLAPDGEEAGLEEESLTGDEEANDLEENDLVENDSQANDEENDSEANDEEANDEEGNDSNANDSEANDEEANDEEPKIRPGEEDPGVNIPYVPVIPEPPVEVGPGDEVPGVNVPELPPPPTPPTPPRPPVIQERPPAAPEVPVFPEFTPLPETIANPPSIPSPVVTRPGGGFLNPSGAFVDLENRVRFNVDTEIEGLPPFITMEMIVGVLLAQDNYDFPASVAIAQIIQEGGYGSFGPGGEYGLGLSRLAFNYHNLFGIKGTGPAGSVNMRTFEMTPGGESFNINDNFRVYNTFTESILDRSELLHNVYSDLTYGVTNANEFAWNIGGRWATDINYARSLIRHMENYDLYRLDEMTLYDYHNLLGEGRFIHPVPGSTITSPFGWRAWDNSFHRGMDFGTGAHNLPIFAADGGEVTFVGYSLTAGNWIIIYHGEGLYTRYMHNLANFVEVGQRVERGQQIALSGTTGNSTGNHLHFEVI